MDKTLTHHGIKGMKWGVRRYQNQNGSLKPAGIKRYSDSSNPSSKPNNSTVSKIKTVIKKNRDKRKQENERFNDMAKSLTGLDKANYIMNRISNGKHYTKKVFKMMEQNKTLSYTEAMVNKQRIDLGKRVILNLLKAGLSRN